MYKCIACGHEIEKPGETCPICGFPVIGSVYGHKKDEWIREYAEEYKSIHPEFFFKEMQDDSAHNNTVPGSDISEYRAEKYKQFLQELEKKYEELFRYVNQLQKELFAAKVKEKKLKKIIKGIVFGGLVPLVIIVAYVLSRILMGYNIDGIISGSAIIAENPGEEAAATGKTTTDPDKGGESEPEAENDAAGTDITKTDNTTAVNTDNAEDTAYVNTDTADNTGSADTIITDDDSTGTKIALGLFTEKLNRLLTDDKYKEIIQLVDSSTDKTKNSKEVQHIYDIAVSGYRNQITAEAADAFENDGYEQALAIVNEGLSVLDGDDTLLSLKAEYETMLPAETDNAAANFSFEDSEGFALARKYGSQRYIAAGYEFAIGINKDGTCITAGDDAPDVSGWDDIVAVTAFGRAAAGLRSDGTVVCSDKRLNADEWKDIVQIEYCSKVERTIIVIPSEYHLIGLVSDGTVVAVGTNNNGECDVSGWNNIVDVAAGCTHSVGLRNDGTVVACGSNENGQCDVSEWSNVVDVAAAKSATYGLTADGKILVAGSTVSTEGEEYVLDVPQWDNAAAIIACHDTGKAIDFIIGICTDGTIVSNRTEYMDYLEPSDIEAFSDVQSAAASSWGFIICSDSNGSVKAVGADDVKMEDINTWPAIQSP